MKEIHEQSYEELMERKDAFFSHSNDGFTIPFLMTNSHAVVTYNPDIPEIKSTSITGVAVEAHKSEAIQVSDKPYIVLHAGSNAHRTILKCFEENGTLKIKTLKIAEYDPHTGRQLVINC